MPLYRCTVAEGLSSLAQREQIASEITRIHCEVTGAPAKFVHVFFAEDREGKLPPGRRAVVLGGIRSGRTPEQKQQLVGDMSKVVADTLATDAAEVLVATADIPARWVMEGGAIMPEPGEEEVWLARHGGEAGD